VHLELRADGGGAPGLTEQLEHAGPLLFQAQADEEAAVVIDAHLKEDG
jgi:hypothetical protein